MNPTTLAAAVGRGLFGWGERLRGFFAVAALTLRGLFGRPGHGIGVGRAVARQQILFSGIHALPLITLIGASVGLIVTLQGIRLLPALGGEALVGRLLVLVVMREVAPLLTAFVVTGRSATAITVELGYMQVLREVDGLRALGIDPARYLVAPRITALVVTVLCLDVYFNLAAFLAGGLVVAFDPAGRSVNQLLGNLLLAISPADIALNVSKALLFGAGIGIVAVSHGLRVRASFTEIPRATISTVVGCLVFCFVLNLGLSLAFP